MADNKALFDDINKGAQLKKVPGPKGSNAGMERAKLEAELKKGKKIEEIDVSQIVKDGYLEEMKLAGK